MKENPKIGQIELYKPIKEIIFPATSTNIYCCKGEGKNLVSIFGTNEISIIDMKMVKDDMIDY